VPTFIEKSASPKPVVAGGQSYGGRVASLAALETRFAGLVLISYPLHRPGHPESLRTEHWPRLDLPVLLLSGTADPFARLELLRREVKKLPHGELVTFQGVGHGLISVADEAMKNVADFVRELVPARR
jgi:predicted alpha/beta-hydrolase family hydrolase